MFTDKFEKLELELHGVRLPEIVLSDEDYKNAGVKPGISNLDFLKQICKNGFEHKLEEGKIKEEDRAKYRERFKTEIDVLVEGGFVDYVLLVWDIINFAKKEKIATGFGRGSGVGSLILFLCGITELDPIEHKLYFERFVSKARIKKKIVDGITYLDGSLLMDIDNDFSNVSREKVVEYVLNKYKGKSCKLSTYSTLTSKILIKECGKIVGEFSEQTMNEVSGYIESIFGKVRKLEESYVENEHFKRFCDENPEVFQIAKKLHGLIKSKGSHASGYLVTYNDLNTCIPIEFGTNGEIVSGYDMYDASDIAVKVDLLGLQDLELISQVCKSVGVNLSDIDINDPFIYECLQDLKTPFGLFQICGDATFRATQKIKPKNFEHLCSILAISRPGSIAFIDKFAKYTNSGELESLDEHLDKVFNITGNVPLFQETLMQCAHEVFGLSLEDAEGIRRACGKKIKEDMMKYQGLIFSQAEKLNLPKETAEKFWSMLISSADYSFNRCLGKDSVVVTQDGPKAISALKVGEKVLALDVEASKNHFVEIKDIIKSKNELFEFNLDNQRSIICSMEHKFLDQNGNMTKIKDILESDGSVVFDSSVEYFVDIPIPEFKGLYKISNHGSVISLPRVGRDRDYRTYGGSKLKGEIDRDGYIRIFLSNNEIRKRYQLHRLVALAFIPNDFNLPCVNHKNGIKKDNSVENLEWISVTENNRHAFKTGLNKYNNALPHFLGEKHHFAKVTEKQVIEMRKLESEGWKKADLARKYSLSQVTVGRIIKRILWTHI